ncbi:hypothetical protein [Nocardia sp. CY41]|uniref:hypothetical protein n=1 Tax=Nocardia sp. CY41 TaxID=2608686 RepID=UPI00135CB9A8|nr:hypothetical protein [Nocardia sp. CY41]
MTGFASEIHAIARRLLAIPGHLGPGAVADACSVVLHEVTQTNEYGNEFEGQPEGGAFSVVSFRVLADPSESPRSMVILEIRQEVRAAEVELRSYFDLSTDHMTFNPRIPPAGAVFFSEQHGNRTLVLQFSLHSDLLQTVAVRENM